MKRAPERKCCVLAAKIAELRRRGDESALMTAGAAAGGAESAPSRCMGAGVALMVFGTIMVDAHNGAKVGEPAEAVKSCVQMLNALVKRWEKEE